MSAPFEESSTVRPDAARASLARDASVSGERQAQCCSGRAAATIDAIGVDLALLESRRLGSRAAPLAGLKQTFTRNQRLVPAAAGPSLLSRAFSLFLTRWMGIEDANTAGYVCQVCQRSADCFPMRRWLGREVHGLAPFQRGSREFSANA